MNVDTARKPQLVAEGVRLGLGSKAALDAQHVSVLRDRIRAAQHTGATSPMSATETAKPATDLKFKRTRASRYYSKGAAHTYLVVRDGGAWLLNVHRVEMVAGIAISGRHVDTTGHRTKALAVAVARRFEALGEDYRQCDHGYMERVTWAIQRAYEEA